MAIGVPEARQDWDRRDADARDDEGVTTAAQLEALVDEIHEAAALVLDGVATDRVPLSTLRDREAAMHEAYRTLCRTLGVRLRDDNGRPLL